MERPRARVRTLGLRAPRFLSVLRRRCLRLLAARLRRLPPGSLPTTASALAPRFTASTRTVSSSRGAAIVSGVHPRRAPPLPAHTAHAAASPPRQRPASAFAASTPSTSSATARTTFAAGSASSSAMSPGAARRMVAAPAHRLLPARLRRSPAR
jgi:hypothetical protein